MPRCGTWSADVYMIERAGSNPLDADIGHWKGDDVIPSPWPVRVDSLLLREASEADFARLLSFRNDPGVNRFMLRTSVEPEVFGREWLAIPTSLADFSCVAESEQEVVAMGFLDIVDGMGQPGMPQGTEGIIGYIIEPHYAGRGLATSIARGLLAAAFDHLDLRRVTAGCFADNSASARVLEKVGMRREQHGIEDSWHAELGWVDGYMYGILASEWRARPRRVLAGYVGPHRRGTEAHGAPGPTGPAEGLGVDLAAPVGQPDV